LYPAPYWLFSFFSEMNSRLLAVFLFTVMVTSKVEVGQKEELSDSQVKIKNLQAKTLVDIDKLTFLDAEVAKCIKDIKSLISGYDTSQKDLSEPDDDNDDELSKLVKREGSIITALKIRDLETKCANKLQESIKERRKILKNSIKIQILECYEPDSEKYENSINILIKLVDAPPHPDTYKDYIEKIGTNFKRDCLEINELLNELHSESTDAKNPDYFNGFQDSYNEEIKEVDLTAMNKTYSLQIIMIIALSCVGVFCLSLFYVKVIRGTTVNSKAEDLSKNSGSKKSNRVANHGSSKHPEVDMSL